MKQKETLHGFTVTRICPIPELQAELIQLEHENTGLRLVWLDRNEENMTFGIGFRTQPWDDTGVFHILEHSVLCGSEKYPLKEPFVELLKSSLNTFLNAMTFQDMTLYPVSSRNRQDLLNLMRVYLDAVFFPRIYDKPEIFCQEGWHYELDASGNASYKGVVFNEMKGALASPDRRIACRVNRLLFPDNCYRFVSGGDPVHIPELTWERFTETHRRLYHPSNACVFLDGAVDIDTLLGVMDAEYLSRFARTPAAEPIPMQKSVDAGSSEMVYELGQEEPLEGRCRLAYGMVAGSFCDREDIVLLQALADVLCGDNHAPLTRRVLESGLAGDVTLTVDGEMLQPTVLLQIKDIDADRADEIDALVRAEITRLADEGPDTERLSATLANLEFQMRERDYGSIPQGLCIGIQVMQSWLYGVAPEECLQVDGLFESLAEKCARGYAKELLRRVFLENPHRCRVLMKPSHTLGEERRAAENARLKSVESWSAAERAEIARRQETLEAWQQSEDTPESLSLLPRLSLSDIPGTTRPLPLKLQTAAGLPILYHDVQTSGIVYLNLYFDAGDFNEDTLSAGALLCALLGELPTENHSGERVQSEMRRLFGSVRFQMESFGRANNPAECRTFLSVSLSALESKLPEALALMGELLMQTDFSDADSVRMLLHQAINNLNQRLAAAGHLCAFGRIRAGLSAEGVVRECTGGYTYYRWLKTLEKDFDARFPALSARLTALCRSTFCTARLTLSVTGKETDASAAAVRMVSLLPAGMPAAAGTIKPWGAKKEGIVIPGDVCYASAGLNLAARGYAVTGQMKVACQVETLGYLWNAVRVQGGAYGVGLLSTSDGLLGTYSYRDPNAKRTIGCYTQLGDALHDICENADTLESFILGVVADNDPLLTPRLTGKAADTNFWRGVSEADRNRTLWEILHAEPTQLEALAPVLRELDGRDGLCVVGPRAQIESCGITEICEL